MSNMKIYADVAYNILKAKTMRRRQPIFLSLFVTNRCNLRCKYCFVSNEDAEKKFLQAEYSLEQIREIVDEFYAMGTRMIFMLGGEPLVHPDIKGIIDYIVGKGIYLHLITNGVLIKKKLNDIKNAHVVCVSIDGMNELNDELRGDGVYAKALEGVKTAAAAGIPTRIHAVLTRMNLKSIRPIAELCRENNVHFTISPPNFLGETDLPYMRISRDEYREFWYEYLSLYNEGLPIGNIKSAIEKCATWPTDYHSYIEKGQRFEGYKPTFCLNGHLYVALGAEGTMYNCINLGCLHGPNINDMSIREAWAKLLDWRPNCVSCASINCIETSMMLDLNVQSILSGLSFHNIKK